MRSCAKKPKNVFAKTGCDHIHTVEFMSGSKIMVILASQFHSTFQVLAFRHCPSVGGTDHGFTA
jgi:hypothetical protein